MIRTILTVVGVILVVVGVGFADNFRGVASSFALWAARHPFMRRWNGPHQWFSVGFQAVVFRVYGAIAGVAGIILLSFIIHTRH